MLQTASDSGSATDVSAELRGLTQEL